MLSSRVKIWSFRGKAHLVFHWCLYNKFWSYTNELKYNLRDKVEITESIDILTSEDMENTPLESRMWFRMNFTSGVFNK